MIKPVKDTTADAIYDILVEVCGASEHVRGEFVRWATSDDPGNEFRFCGMFGMAGKVWLAHEKWYVSGPNREEIKRVHNPDEMTAAVLVANSRLTALRDKNV